jgi:hypothetical protein
MGVGNHFKGTFEFQSSTQGLKAFTVSDGKTVLTQAEVCGKPYAKSLNVTPRLGESRRTFFSRGVQQLIGSSFSFDEIDDVKPYAFKLVGKDKVGDRDANVIEYQVGKAPPSGVPPLTGAGRVGNARGPGDRLRANPWAA